MDWPIKSLWDHAEARQLSELLDRSSPGDGTRPPVFQEQYADCNILVPPGVDAATQRRITSLLPTSARHRWFRSMKSSQALAQSVFANLIVQGDLNVLNGLRSDQGSPAFGLDLGGADVQLEYEVGYLGEPRPTSVDVSVNGARRIAVECKFTEAEFGKCSRPALRPGKDSNYHTDHCDGSYTRQRGRNARCSLSELGIRYWRYIPELLPGWPGDRDHSPCPLRFTYQIVRNILAACVTRDGKLDPRDAHALIIHDARNPEMHPGGACRKQLDAVRAALEDPSLLRTCTWQSVVEQLAHHDTTRWLAESLRDKYAF